MTDKPENCYHCGGDLPVGAPPESLLGGAPRYFCCAGCQAIALTIHGQGLEAFYARRWPTGEKLSLEAAATEPPARLAVYDDPALNQRFIRRSDDAVCEVTLRLEKIRCAACVWLNEQHLRRLPGVVEVDANYVTQRARIRYRAAECRLSQLLHAVERIGYAAWPFEPSIHADAAKRERQSMLMRLAVAMLGMMQVMMYAWPAYSGAEDLLLEHAQLLGWASFALTLPVIFYSAGPILVSAYRSVYHSVKNFGTSGMLGMDVPVALALWLAFISGTGNLIAGSGETYFDSVTMFVALLLAARYIELRARHAAQSGAEALAKQLPATCERLLSYPHNLAGEIIAVVRANAGDILRVAPGDALPADGVVVDGVSAVDEALLSGESRPVEKRAGDSVLAGSFNLQSPLLIKVRAVGQATRLAGIAQLLDRALQEKPRIASVAEKWAGYFVAVLLVLALGTGLMWAHSGAKDAWVHAVAVLVVSCPCALSLATPAAMAAAQGALTKSGLLVVRGHALETLAAATDLVLDKTGTLTTGELRLTAIDILREGITESDALACAAGLEVGQKHPIARAMTAAALERAITLRHFSDMPTGVVGQGVACEGMKLGSANWAGAPHSPAAATDSVIYLADATGVLARFTLDDDLRPGVDMLVAHARSAAITVHLLSGDHPHTVASWAQRLGIDHWIGGASPEQKQAHIKALQDAGRIVWAVGDGVNDAPQLAQANMSVAVGSGAPLAQAGADVVLTTASLAPLAQMLHHARKTRRIIRQNLAWAFAYNLLAIPAAAAGWISPFGAAIGMSASSLAVTLNAWRLRKL